MKIKKYVAKSMPEALQLVRDELGEAAVIVNTRQLRRNSRFNQHDEPCVEVTAAMDEAVTPARLGVEADVPGATREEYAGTGGMEAASPTRGLAGAAAVRRYAAQSVRDSAPAVASRLQPTTAPVSGLVPPVEPMGGDLARTIEYLKNAAEPEAGPSLEERLNKGSVRADDSGPSSSAKEADLSAQLRRLQETVSRLDHRVAPGLLLPAAVTRLVDRVRSMGLSEDLCDAVIQRIFATADHGELEDRSRAGQKMVEVLVEKFPPYKDIIKIGRRQKTIAFVGSSGAGKTTATAKIAAGFAMKRKDRIVLISADDKRVGAMDQVQAFTDIIGIPLEVAYEAEDLSDIVGRYDSAQLVLVDTPGCGSHDHQGWERQRRLLEAAGVDEVQVVLDGMASLDHMLDLIEATEVFPNRRLLFTKLDEVVHPGAIISAAVRSQIPVSYLANGPEVPGAIEAADLAKLVGKMLGVGPHQEQ